MSDGNIFNNYAAVRVAPISMAPAPETIPFVQPPEERIDEVAFEHYLNDAANTPMQKAMAIVRRCKVRSGDPRLPINLRIQLDPRKDDRTQLVIDPDYRRHLYRNILQIPEMMRPVLHDVVNRNDFPFFLDIDWKLHKVRDKMLDLKKGTLGRPKEGYGDKSAAFFEERIYEVLNAVRNVGTEEIKAALAKKNARGGGEVQWVHERSEEAEAAAGDELARDATDTVPLARTNELDDMHNEVQQLVADIGLSLIHI